MQVGLASREKSFGRSQYAAKPQKCLVCQVFSEGLGRGGKATPEGVIKGGRLGQFRGENVRGKDVAGVLGAANRFLAGGTSSPSWLADGPVGGSHDPGGCDRLLAYLSDYYHSSLQ